jgi:2-amino-4-hydroxy-6-hydroxymethyldihydropteridine diphosphokinase
MFCVYFSLGSNLGDSIDFVRKGIKSIEGSIGQVIKCSSLYETEPVGFKAETQFVNCCVLVKTTLDPYEILERIHTIENLAERKRSKASQYESRTLDIDIILFDKLIVLSPTLNIPHPHYRNRLFVLIPLLEIAPDLVDHQKNMLIKEILLHCEDKSKIRKLGHID